MKCNDFVKLMLLKVQNKKAITMLFFTCYFFYSCTETYKQNALPPKECAPFKEGVFYNKDKSYKIVRTANNQVEYDLLTNTSYHFEVHWLYDCAYNLTFKHTTNKSDTFALKPNDLLRIQFTEIKGNSVIYEVDFKEERFKSVMYLER